MAAGCSFTSNTREPPFSTLLGIVANSDFQLLAEIWLGSKKRRQFLIHKDSLLVPSSSLVKCQCEECVQNKHYVSPTKPTKQCHTPSRLSQTINDSHAKVEIKHISTYCQDKFISEELANRFCSRIVVKSRIAHPVKCRKELTSPSSQFCSLCPICQNRFHGVKALLQHYMGEDVIIMKQMEQSKDDQQRSPMRVKFQKQVDELQASKGSTVVKSPSSITEHHRQGSVIKTHAEHGSNHTSASSAHKTALKGKITPRTVRTLIFTTPQAEETHSTPTKVRE